MTNAQTTTAKTFDVEKIRRDFPSLNQSVYGKPLVYLDNAATAQKPNAVIDVTEHYYRVVNANIHRGVHRLSQLATDAYEGAREKIRNFINAEKASEIIYTRGCTEAINLVAATYGRQNVGAGDEVLITEMEHHSNIVPWQALCEEKGATLRVAPVNERGEVDLEAFERMIGERTKIVAFAHQSNSLGTINPAKEMTRMAREKGAATLIDGAQSIPHFRVDVRDLGCDFYAFSAHKMYGPTGSGALYGREELLESMPPYQFGGDMISAVSFEKTTYNKLPYKFEAGTPNIAGGIGFGAAVDYVESIGIDEIERYERELSDYAWEKLRAIEGLRIIGTAEDRGAVFSFVVEGAHAHDLATILDVEGVAVRAGHLCTQPILKKFGVPAVARAAVSLYNTREEIDRLVEAIEKAKRMLG
jgi:cysteine desulfurase / selenocysteine lyase